MKIKNKLPLVGFLALLLGATLYTTNQIPQASEAKNQLKVAFMDVGQGDAILLTTPNRRHILIDGGPDSTILTRLGEEMRFYEHSIDLVVPSHNHADHITGLNNVLERYDVKKMWISGAIHTTNEYLEMLQNIKQKNIAAEVAFKGKVFEVDGLQLEVIHPLASAEGTQPDDQHDATIVIRASYGNKSFLLTGDIDESHEQIMVADNAPLRADVLKVPHHGSKSGLALNFLNLINPQYAVIQSGKDNKFGHPAPSIIDKLESKGIAIFRNDSHGTIRFFTAGTTLSVKP